MDFLPAAPVESPQPRSLPTGRPTQAVASSLNDHILEAALGTFQRDGADGTTMEGLAKACGVSKRTLYKRFGSRSELLVKSIEHGVLGHVQQLVGSPRHESLRPHLLDISLQMLDASLRPQVIALDRLIAEVSVRDRDLYLRMFALMHRARIVPFEQALQAAHERGEALAGTGPEIAALLFDALVLHPRRQITIKQAGPVSPEIKEAMVARMLDLVLGGLALDL